jgi:hypothetical protein
MTHQSLRQLIMPNFGGPPQQAQQTRAPDPYANLRHLPLHTLPAPTHDFSGKPVPPDLANGFKPDSINQYHEFLKAVLYGHPDTARQIKESRNPKDWEWFGRNRVTLNRQHWDSKGRDDVVQFASKAIQDSQQPRIAPVQKTKRTMLQNKLLGKLAEKIRHSRPLLFVGKRRQASGSSPGGNLTATMTHHYPQSTSGQNTYAPRWPAGDVRANQQAELWRNGQVYYDARTANIDDGRLKTLTAGSMPLGFANEWEFKQFRLELREALHRDGIQDSVAGLYGTSTTFYSRNLGKPVNHHFDSKGPKTSDLDLYIKGPTVMETLKHQPIMGGVYSNPTVKNAFSHVNEFSKRWETFLGRKVSVIVPSPSLDEPESWKLHSPPQLSRPPSG